MAVVFRYTAKFYTIPPSDSGQWQTRVKTGEMLYSKLG